MSGIDKNQDKSLTEGDQPERHKKPNKRHIKAIEGGKTYTTDPSKNDIVYLARELVLCTLPHSDPGDVRAWGRRNGDLSLSVKPGIKQDRKTGEYFSVGIPYGIIPRLILMWMVTEIRRTGSRRLELGHHFNEFLTKIGLSGYTGRGPRGDARRVREQMERLFRAVISFEYEENNGKRYGATWLDMQVAPHGVFWWSEEKTDKDLQWGSWIEVSEAFFQAVMAFPTPLDIRVLRHVKDSCLGIDLYAILNREAFRAMKDGNSRFLAWEWLHEQTGNEIASLHNFRRNALVQIKEILEVHSGLIVSIQKGCKGQKSGIWISNLSNPSIPPEEPRQILERTKVANGIHPVLVLAPKPPTRQERHLSPASIEQFCMIYRGLDPYVCKVDFDTWIAEKPEERNPRNYDKAFLGFAAKWATKKT
ncbi:MAG: replication protein RepA [Candidatus Methylumidiphilus sp.]